MNVRTTIGAAVAGASLAAVVLVTPAGAGAEEVDRCQGAAGMHITVLRVTRPLQQIQALYPGEVATTLYVQNRITVHLTEAGYVMDCRNG
jgi:hypothetical protein